MSRAHSQWGKDNNRQIGLKQYGSPVINKVW